MSWRPLFRPLVGLPPPSKVLSRGRTRPATAPDCPAGDGTNSGICSQRGWPVGDRYDRGPGLAARQIGYAGGLRQGYDLHVGRGQDLLRWTCSGWALGLALAGGDGTVHHPGLHGDLWSEIDEMAFPSTPAEWFWTSSPFTGSSGYAWVVDFGYGYSSNFDVGLYYRVRCVR